MLRNLRISARHRDEARRLRREQACPHAGPGEATIAVDEAYERLELHRFLAEQVMALDEALRTVVVLRYFEGLDSGGIAALTAGCPSPPARATCSSPGL